MMEYKGYVAAVEFDDSIDVLHGRVVNSGPYPIATFEATDAKELRREFERSVDEYLEWCAEDGVEPGRPFSRRAEGRHPRRRPDSYPGNSLRNSASGNTSTPSISWRRWPAQRSTLTRFSCFTIQLVEIGGHGM